MGDETERKEDPTVAYIELVAKNARMLQGATEALQGLKKLSVYEKLEFLDAHLDRDHGIDFDSRWLQDYPDFLNKLSGHLHKDMMGYSTPLCKEDWDSLNRRISLAERENERSSEHDITRKDLEVYENTLRNPAKSLHAFEALPISGAGISHSSRIMGEIEHMKSKEHEPGYHIVYGPNYRITDAKEEKEAARRRFNTSFDKGIDELCGDINETVRKADKLVLGKNAECGDDIPYLPGQLERMAALFDRLEEFEHSRLQGKPDMASRAEAAQQNAQDIRNLNQAIKELGVDTKHTYTPANGNRFSVNIKPNGTNQPEEKLGISDPRGKSWLGFLVKQKQRAATPDQAQTVAPPPRR